MATTLITPSTDHDERFDVTVTLDGGETETLTGLYDVQTCLDYSHMKIAYDTNKYIRRASLTNRYGNR